MRDIQIWSHISRYVHNPVTSFDICGLITNTATHFNLENEIENKIQVMETLANFRDKK